MTSNRWLLIGAPLVLASAVLAAQGRGLDPADLLKPLGDQWPTYSGDYSGKRYSSLKQINQTTVKSLTLAWIGQADRRSRAAAAAAAAAGAA